MPFTVLVIDDDADTRENLWDILEMDGYAVETAGTAAEVRSRANWDAIGAIVLDRRLPDALAESLLPDLKRFAPHADVLIVTGYSDVQGAIAAFRLGAADYIIKPIEPGELLARIGRIAETSRTRRELQAAQAAREQALVELRSTTQQLWQSARLAGVGELAAGIAHELNNPLGIVHLRLESILAHTAKDDPRRHALEVIDSEVERMARLVANLLQFSRPGRDQVSTVNVPDEVSRTLELTDHLFRRRRIAVKTDFHPEVPDIFADRQQLRQVLLNLFTNAADAMLHGGKLDLGVHPAELAEDRSAVSITVADTGVGIDPAHLPRVTEPFFSTKEEGKGTGLGLAICRRIIDQHDGRLDITSALGAGTTVRVVLPVKNSDNVSELRANAE
ncbi:MAG: ATP-binding protein [Gemmataceae bacterium]